MIPPETFCESLNRLDICFFTGVPDSVLQPFCNYLTNNFSSDEHIVCANEGGAISIAIGYHLVTKKIALVYMQNSGLGNAVNPLLSMADRKVYSIPVLLLIGWRGQPGTYDEPQHSKQGQITLPLLRVMKIPYRVIGENLLSTKKALQTAITHMKRNQEPFALVVKRDTFLPCRLKDSDAPLYPAREDVIRLIMKSLSSDTLLISTTGTISRETWEVKNELGGNQNAVFLSVGGMGHASQIALGAALKKPDRRVVCLDGDGAMLMHMGSLAINGTRKLPNFFHIVLNNGSHDSVGGQPTVGWDIEFCGIARAVGYEVVLKADSIAGVIQSLETLRKCKGPSFFEVRVGKGHRRSLPRPTKGLARIKESFIKCTADSNGTTEL